MYDPEYLERGTAAWELDPTTIRTKQRSAFTRVAVSPFPVFCDVALSGWSLDIIERSRAEILGTSESQDPWGWMEKLLYAPVDGFGALFIGELNAKPDVEQFLAGALTSVTKESLSQVSISSSSVGAMGGERPKMTGFHRTHPGAPDVPVLIKFALPSEPLDSVVAEATALTLGCQLGLNVPGHHILEMNGTPALCIERFDRGGVIMGPVFHCVSAATALGIVPFTDREDPRRSYVGLRSKLKHPADAIELFRRIVLNAAVGNGDDHPWNSSLQQVGMGEWRLSPLFDVMPFLHRRMPPVFSMSIAKNGSRTGTLQNLISAGRQVAGFKRDEEAVAVIESIHSHVRCAWRGVFESHARPITDASPDRWAGVFEPNATGSAR